MKDYLAKKTIQHKVDGETMTFRAVPMKLIFKLRAAKDGVAKALASFLTDKSKDAGVEELQSPSDKTGADGGALYVLQTVKKAADPSIVSLRARQQEEGINALLALLCSEDMQGLVVECICSSGESLEEEDVKDFLDNVDVGTFREFATGTFKACAGAFGNLGNFLSRLNLQDAARKVVDGVASGLGAETDQD